MSKLEDMKHMLRERYRIKYGVDYAITVKYGSIRVMCHGVWKDRITEVADHFSIVIDQWFTYQ